MNPEDIIEWLSTLSEGWSDRRQRMTENPDELRLQKEVFAKLTLSGTPIEVGVTSTEEGGSVWIRIEDAPEPSYLSTTDIKLLIAALKVGIQEVAER